MPKFLPQEQQQHPCLLSMRKKHKHETATLLSCGDTVGRNVFFLAGTITLMCIEFTKKTGIIRLLELCLGSDSG